jgi:type IV pilus assembly protein PilA
MKTKLKKYLSGSREGFSLVELIIVIAIMAILIGVVALAVIPYLQRSRESKDLSTLDTVCSALTSAVATSQASGKGVIRIADGNLDGASVTESTDKAAAQAVLDDMKTELSSGSKKLTSQNASGGDIVCVFDTSNNTAYVFGTQKNGDTSATTLKNTVTGYTSATTSTKPEGPKAATTTGEGESATTTAADEGYALVVSN